MRDAKPDVCVVIPTLNEYDTIGELVEGLGELDEIRVRIIVVDDGAPTAPRRSWALRVGGMTTFTS